MIWKKSKFCWLMMENDGFCSQLREIGLEFFNCDNSDWVQGLAQRIAADSAGKYS